MIFFNRFLKGACFLFSGKVECIFISDGYELGSSTSYIFDIGAVEFDNRNIESMI